MVEIEMSASCESIVRSLIYPVDIKMKFASDMPSLTCTGLALGMSCNNMMIRTKKQR